MKRKVLCLLTAVLLLSCLLCAVPAAAVEDTADYVIVYDGFLDQSEVQRLNEAAKEVSERHGCGVYVVVFEDMADYGFSSIERFSEEIYGQWNLGLGADRNCIILCMSMADRDYDLCAHGDDAHYAFTDYGKEMLAETFLDDFRRNDWAEGFSDYIRKCDSMLTQAENGNPIDIDRPGLGTVLGSSAVIGVIIGIVFAFIYGAALKGKMKSERIATEASEYISDLGIRMYDEQDVFTHSTVTRQHIDRDSGSRGSGGHGGTSVNSGGFSHSSGKF